MATGISNRLLEVDKWTAGRGRIEAEIERRLEGILRVKSMESLCEQRGWIEALRWAIAEVDPPRRENNYEDC